MLGRNLTPVPIVEAARDVMGMGGITNDYCSDSVANQSIQADFYYSFADDGYRHLLKSPYGNVFMNPPGSSWTGGSKQERGELFYEFLPAIEQDLPNAKANLEMFLKDRPHIKRISAADWYRALYHAWVRGDITRAIWVLYRGGSFGSLGKAMLQDSVLCLTAAGAESDCINGSGRLAFETVNENDQRVPQTSNTQSSIIGYLPNRTNLKEERAKFCNVFSQFGACGGFWLH